MPPRVRSVPKAFSTAGGEAIDLAESAGLFLDIWQKRAVCDILAEDKKGNWAAFEAGLLVPRQNGKGAVLECIELAALFLFDCQLIIHTAHEFKTAQEAFRRIRFLVENTPELLAQVKKNGITTGNGNEGIELKTGARLRFLARSGGSGRGFSCDLLIYDEAYELPEETVAASLPTLSARDNPMVIYTSSAALANSEVLRTVMARGRCEKGRKKDKGLCYIEFSADPKADLDDKEVWRLANPATESKRIKLKFIAKERKAMSDVAFGRERLGIVDESAGQTVIDMDRWGLLATKDADGRELESFIFGAVPGHERRGTVSLAIDVNFDGSMSSIAMVGRQAIKGGNGWYAGKKIQGEIVDRRAGTGWVVDRVKQLIERWGPLEVALDPKGSPGKLLPSFEAEGIEVTKITYTEHTQACGYFEELVMGPVDDKGRHDEAAPKLFVHLDDTHLNDAVEAGRRRHPGEGGDWLWHRRDTTDISCLVALTLAVFSFVRAEHRAPASQGVSTAMYSYQ